MKAKLEDLLEVVIEPVERKIPEHALPQIEAMLQDSPDSPLLWQLEGDLLLQAQKTGKAIARYEKLRAALPDHAGSLASLAFAYLQRGWHKKARETFAAGLEKDDSDLIFWLGLLECQDSDKAYETMPDLVAKADAALQKTGQNPAYFHLSHLLALGPIMDEGAFDEAASQLAASCDAFGEGQRVAEALLRQAERLLQQRLHPVIFRYLDAAARIWPDAPNLERLQRQVQPHKELIGDLGKLALDEDIDEVWQDIFADIIGTRAQADEGQRRVGLKLIDMAILEAFPQQRQSVLHIQQRHPQLYALKAPFFERLMQSEDLQEEILSLQLDLIRLSIEFPQAFGEKDLEHLKQLRQEIESDSDVDLSKLPLEPDPAREPDTKKSVPTMKVGRNDPCPCGSGRKYKKCCGR